jgi:hypothetical protein
MRRGRAPSSGSRLFRIVVRGEFGDLLGTAFEDISTESSEGRTVLTARIRDEQHLYGIMDRLRDLGIHIISLGEVREERETPDEPSQRS